MFYHNLPYGMEKYICLILWIFELNLDLSSVLNSNLTKCCVIVAASISQDLSSSESAFGMYDTYAILQPEYSTISNKKILATILTHVGTDNTDVNATVTHDVFVSDISSTDGITINQIRVFTQSIRTIRAKILVLYTD